MAFGITRDPRRYNPRPDFDQPSKPPEPDLIGEALGCPYRYATGEVVDGIVRETGGRYCFERVYFTKIKVLVDLFEPFAPEPLLNEWYSVDLNTLQERFWAKQLAKSQKRAAAVEKYNAAHPDALYGYLATWKTQCVFAKDDVDAALAGKAVALTPLIH